MVWDFSAPVEPFGVILPLASLALFLSETPFFWMDLTFFLPPGDIFTALIFKENIGFWEATLGAFLLDEEANASLFVLDDIMESLLLALDAFLLASEAFLLASEALLLASDVLLLVSEALLLASEAFLLEAEVFLLASEALLLEAEALLLASEAFLLEAEAFLLVSEAFLLESETLLLEAEAFLLESEAFLLESETFLLEEEASLLEVEAFLFETEVPLLETEAFFLEAENATPFVSGPDDIFITLTGTRFPLTRRDAIIGFDLNAVTLSVILFEGLIFFASIFGFADNILFGVFGFFLLIVEEEDFFGFLFLLDIEALLMSSSMSLLISRCILLDLDLNMLSF